MLPANPYNPNQPRRQHRPRPLNPTDSALTTGLVSNPNGTYTSNNFPQGNAGYGQQGQYGAMLPQVDVAGQANNEAWRNFNPLTAGANVPGQKLNLPSLFAGLPQGDPLDDYAARVGQQIGIINPNQALLDMRGRGYQAPPTGSGRSGQELRNETALTTGEGADDFFARNSARETAVMNTVMAGLAAGDTSVVGMLPLAAQEAILGEVVTATNPAAAAANGGIGTGIDEGADMTPAQLEQRYYQNLDTQAKFLSQKRWDAGRKKMITVGQWMKDEKKKYNKKGRRKEGRREQAAAPAEAAPTEAKPAEFTGQSFGVVNFNTATG